MRQPDTVRRRVCFLDHQGTGRRTALKADWHVVVHLLLLETDVTQVLAVARFAAVVLVVQGNAASAAASGSTR